MSAEAPKSPREDISPNLTVPPPTSAIEPNQAEGENEKNLPQIQSQNELIAQIVLGIKELALELDKPTSDLLKPSVSNLDFTHSNNSTPSGSNASLSGSTSSTSDLEHLNPKDFTRESSLKMEIPKLSPFGNPIELKDFGSRVFKAIRETCNISTASYVESWNLSPAQMQMKTGAGRSGSLFLFSKDKRYIFKTIPHEEVENFLLLLPDYYKHLQTYPDSLIMRVFGLHRFRYAFASYLYIIVFGNVIHAPVQMDEVFDLKGRKPKPGKQGRNKGKSGIVFKDNDLDKHFLLSPEKKTAFAAQLKADVEFLSNHNMMDYSFLIGVRKGKSNETEKTQTSPRSKEDVLELKEEEKKSEELHKSGDSTDTKQVGEMRKIPSIQVSSDNVTLKKNQFLGIESSNSEETYYLGIIDCLTAYSQKKKSANFFKSWLWKQEELSTVDPPYYAERFLKYMVESFE